LPLSSGGYNSGTTDLDPPLLLNSDLDDDNERMAKNDPLPTDVDDSSGV